MSTQRRFSDQVVVVTGGASGIGAACAERFGAEGATCHVLDVADAEHPVDATDEAAVVAFFDALPAAADVVVCAAGGGGGGRIVDLDFADWRRVVSLNLDSAFLCLRAAARRMRDAGKKGAIVNVSSLSQEWPLTGFGPYSAGKAGVRMLTRVAALELGPLGIRVNAVAPGPIDTALAAPLRAIPGVDDDVADHTPLESRWGTPAEVASVVAFLASDDARWVTGRVITVDGGNSLSGVPDFLRHAERLVPEEKA